MRICDICNKEAVWEFDGAAYCRIHLPIAPEDDDPGDDADESLEKNGHYITTKQAQVVIDMLSRTMSTYQEISDVAGVSLHTIHQIKSGHYETLTDGPIKRPRGYRKQRGTRSLTIGQAKEIVSILRNTDEPLASIAERFGVSEGVIEEIQKGRNYKDASGGRRIIRPGVRKWEKQDGPKLDANDVRTIRDLAKKGTPHKVIGKRYGINTSYVSKIVRKMRWAHID